MKINYNLTPFQKEVLALAIERGRITAMDTLMLGTSLNIVTSPERTLQSLVARQALSVIEMWGNHNGDFYEPTKAGLAMHKGEVLERNPNLVKARTHYGSGKYESHLHNPQENVRNGADNHIAHPSRHEGRLYFRDGSVMKATHACPPV